MTSGFAQSSYGQTLFPARPAGGATFQQLPSGSTSSSGSSASSGSGGESGRFGREDHNAGSLFGAVDIAKNLAIIAIIVALVSLVKWAQGGRRRGIKGAS